MDLIEVDRANKKQYAILLQSIAQLSRLFSDSEIPLINYRAVENIFCKSFNATNLSRSDIAFDAKVKDVGVGIKTFILTGESSLEKVAEFNSLSASLSKYSDEELAHNIALCRNERIALAYRLYEVKSSCYHIVGRRKNELMLFNTDYSEICTDRISNVSQDSTKITFKDGLNEYSYLFSKSTLYQRFVKPDHIQTIPIDIIEDPLSFLLRAFELIETEKAKEEDVVEVYLPLYSYKSKEVEEKSGLNAWNAAPKSKGSDTPRPLNEVYIPIPKKFHQKHPSFFTHDIFKLEEERKRYTGRDEDKPEARFDLKLPNGKLIPSLVTQDNMKGLQSGSNTEIDIATGKRYGQSALGQWLLVDVLGLKERKLVTREWLQQRGTDSVRLWRHKDDYSVINIDFAPIGAFEAFMNDEPIPIMD